jgi:4-diphosphocytidyl-2C-methyl-D-erythritol kinase
MVLSENSHTRITLALDIIRRIGTGPLNGYHELQAVKHRISLHDTISVEPGDTLTIECDNPLVPCDKRNVCYKAAMLLKEQYAVDANVSIRIEKRIPVQGGLAGGSANAATTMRLLNRLWDLNLDTDALCALGREIGMDVPYYFMAPTCVDTEAGGNIEIIDTDISLDFVLCIPSFGVSTGQAYSLLDYKRIGAQKDKTQQLIAALENNNRKSIAASIHNDFEQFVFKAYPQLKALKEKLLAAGCMNAVLSGSGSTVVGIAESAEHAQRISGSIQEKTVIASTHI